MAHRTLPDLNVLVALTDPDHEFHPQARNWFRARRGSWGLCPLTEAGFIRVTANPAIGSGARSVAQSVAILQALKALEGHQFWSITDGWMVLTAPFASRIQGHQQVTDAYLLGLAISQGGVLVTFDRGIGYLAGQRFSRHLLVLE